VVAISGVGLEVTLAKDETIWTETSHKFSLEELRQMALDGGFRLAGTWTDESWPFADCLFVVG
jgi:L-histidine Nalpha-methyltransferase